LTSPCLPRRFGHMSGIVKARKTVKKQRILESSEGLDLSHALAKEHVAATGISFKGVNASAELLGLLQDAVDEVNSSTTSLASAAVKSLAK
jgi:hypothetical protein